MEQNQQKGRKIQKNREELTWIGEPFSIDGTPSDDDISRFVQLIRHYYSLHGRDLPWRRTSDPYRILISEMMLQQTQVSRVLAKYQKFIQRFPSMEVLAEAPFSEIFSLWQGLGYNRRAKALSDISRISMERYQGMLPETYDELISLPMVGPATASAVIAFAWNRPSLYLETNIRRVLLYWFFSGTSNVRDRELYPLLERMLDRSNPKHWYYALMDYGAYLRTAAANPNIRSAHYGKQAPFKNSNRQVRGMILLLLNESGPSSLEKIASFLDFEQQRIMEAAAQLEQEGLVVRESSAGQGAYTLEDGNGAGKSAKDRWILRIP